jgi:hypothetical protein
MIKGALEEKGFKNLKDASKVLGISAELLRVTLCKGHIPKDNTLTLLAEKLDIDAPLLVLAAHQERIPDEFKGFFLTPSQSRFQGGKREFPFSEVQTTRLDNVLDIDEIAMLRKYRQVTEEARMEITSFVDFVYGSKRGAEGSR